MASTKPSKFKPCLILLLISCTPLLNIIQTSHAAPEDGYNNILNTTSNKNETRFDWYDQKTWLPADPVKCVESFREAGVCLTDFLTNFGRPSAACCKALNNIDSSCLPALMPLLNPYIGHILGDLCSFLSSGGGVFPFPFTPSVPSGDAGATSPPPSVPGGSVGVSPPPPSTPSGSADATPPPASDEDEDDDDEEC